MLNFLKYTYFRVFKIELIINNNEIFFFFFPFEDVETNGILGNFLKKLLHKVKE